MAKNAFHRERNKVREDRRKIPQAANWIETYGGLGASLLVSIGEKLLVKGSAGRAFRWELWFASSFSQV
jgi:hypothetical protein